MIWLALILLLWSLLFGAVAADLLSKREFLHPEGDHIDRWLRIIMTSCSIGAAFAAGLML